MRGLPVTEVVSRKRWLLTLMLALALAVMLSLGSSTQEARAQFDEEQQPTGDQYEDSEDNVGTLDEYTTEEYTSGAYGPCSGAAEQLALERPNVTADVIESYLNYLSDVGGCVSREGTTFIEGLSAPVYDPDTGEELGILKDLDPDLTGGDFSLTYEEFCAGFTPQILTAQDYYDQQANSQEQAILDPDGDGLACSSITDGRSGEGGADDLEEPSGEDHPCAGLEDILELPSGFIFYPDAGGCIFLTGEQFGLTLDQLNAPLYDPETGAELGLMKDLDPDLTSGDFSVAFQDICGDFPTTDASGTYEDGVPLGGLTAQDYYDRLANDQEKNILDPNGDGLACTDEDEAFLPGDVGGEGASGRDEPCPNIGGNLLHVPEINGCLVVETIYPVVGIINGDVFDADTGEKLGAFKELVDLDSTYELIGLDLSHKEFCGAFPTTDAGGDYVHNGTPIGNLTAQEYFDRSANSQERTILDPNGDGLACTPDDETFLPGFPSGGTNGQQPGDGQRLGGGQWWPGGEQWFYPAGYYDPPSLFYRPIDFTTYIINNPHYFATYCRGVLSETYSGLPQGRLPETGGGWTALLLSGAALLGGGWLLVRLARRFSG